jgi:DNA replication ATP-dependent helicase Dna2
MKQTRIYVATVATAVTYPELLDFVDFDIAIVDEASQVTEANLVGLLSKIQRFVLIGDERQLPAISLQQNTLKVTTNANLVQIHLSDANKSLFQRLLECAKSNNWQKSYALLSAQARMHRDIMLFPGEYFYNRSLKIFDEADQTAENDKFKKSEKFFAEQLATHRFSFINTPIEKHSKYNSTEADTVVKIIETITDELDEINENTIGVISPFRMQCATIMKKLPENLADRIAVDTVEKFQGSQRDFIIISMAVNFPYLISKIKSETIVDGQTVDRKLNVAITRARSHVIILGNAALLSESFIYAKLIDFCKNRGAYFDLDEIQSMTKNS